MNFYTKFLDYIIPPRPTELLLRGLPPHSLTVYACPRRILVHSHESVVSLTALSSYIEPYIRAAIVETKFHGNTHAARLLGNLTSTYLQQASAVHLTLIPVPLSASRKRERGYNQVERIARVVARSIPEKVTVRTDVLYRTRDTVPQTSLGRRDRLKNVAQAFSFRGPVASNHTYIVLDDVTTTGTTLAEAVYALRSAGATHIRALAVAFQPIGNER